MESELESDSDSELNLLDGIFEDTVTPTVPIQDDHDYPASTSAEIAQISCFDDIKFGITALILTLIQKQFEISSQLSLSTRNNTEKNILHNSLLESFLQDETKNPEKIKQSLLGLQPSVFKHQFRVSTSTCEFLILQLGQSEHLKRNRRGRTPIPAVKTILIGLWILGSQESYRSSSHRFNVTQNTVHRSVVKFCSAVSEILTPTFIKWPNQSGKSMSEEKFREKFEISNVLGVIGNLHISIDVPKSVPQDYLNENGSYSIQLLAICDSNMYFTYCQCGFPGNLNHNQVLEKSELNSNGEDLCSPNYCLVGSKEYSTKKWLISSVVSDKVEHENLNSKLESVGCEIDKAFVLLKSRFERLQCHNTRNIEISNEIVIATCTLHNVCLSKEDYANEWIKT